MGIKPGRNLIVLPLVYLVALVVGLFTLLKILYEIYSEGKDEVLRVTTRNKPAVLTDNKYGKHCYITLPESRIKLHYVINGEEGRPLMVFLHGFPQCWYSWRHQIVEFSKDYRTVAVDLRGFGESDKPRWLWKYDTDEMAEDIRQLVESLNYRSCIVVGHDVGGTVGWVLATRYPRLVTNLILSNCPHPAALWEMANVDPIYTSRIMWQKFLYLLPVLPFIYLRSRDLAQLQEYMQGGETGAKPDTYTEEDIEVYKYTYQSKDALSAALKYYKAAILCHLPLYKSQRCTVPTLMIWGARQQMIPKEACVVTKKRVDTYAITGTLSGSHWIHEEEPGEVNAFIREYIETGKVEMLAKKGDVYEITKGFAT